MSDMPSSTLKAPTVAVTSVSDRSPTPTRPRSDLCTICGSAAFRRRDTRAIPERGLCGYRFAEIAVGRLTGVGRTS